MDRNGYNPSILQDKEECWVSKQSNCELHRHEVFYGTANRKLSKRYGLWVYLTPYWHNMSNNGVHSNKALDARLKAEAQAKFEETHTRQEFVEIFGRNYIYEEK